MKQLFFSGLCLLLYLSGMAQQPKLNFVHPYHPTVTTSKSRNYISGNTCKKCSLTINDKSVKVFPTGAFAIQLDLAPGDSLLQIKSTNSSGVSTTKKLLYKYKKPEGPQEIKNFRIASVEATPSGKSWVLPGDRLELRIKAQPGNRILINNEYPAYEQPKSLTGGIGGIYQFTHVIKENDPLLKKTIRITLENEKKQKAGYSLSPQIRILNPDVPVIGKTKGSIPYLEFGKGTDRLGGAKINYLDTAVLLHITGMSKSRYRVSLAEGHTAYIPKSQVKILPKGTFVPHSLAGSWKVWGDEKYDYASIYLGKRLPYTNFQKIDPARIVVDIYGATANTNWITQLKSAKEIKAVWYEQKSDDVLRVTLSLKHPQHWGYAVYYENNNLVIRVKRPPNQPLSKMTIAVDAGHGGRQTGAKGPTGILEKTITLQVAKRLEKLLSASGATVIMTRKKDVTTVMRDRILRLRKEDPDLLISIHCNSAGDPIHVKGTSTYYRYIGFRPLSQAILNRMLDLGFHNFGNIGRFNFALNGPTEFPNALVETLFLSNPEDEMKALDPAFQEKMAAAIKKGIIDFLKESQKEAEAN